VFRRALTYALMFSLLFTLPAIAAKLKGVEYPDKAMIQGEELALQGLGLRSKFVFKVYVGALYLKTPTSDADAVIKANEVKQISMTFMRDVDYDSMTGAFKEGFEANAPDKVEMLEDKIEKFLKLFTEEVKEGQQMVLTYKPGIGTMAEQGGKVLGTIEGEDFMEALWSIWFGPKPPSKDLKKGMLGIK